MTTEKRNVVITGSTRNIGMGIARAFLENGYRVAVNGRSKDRLAEAVRELKVISESIVGIEADASKESGAQKLCQLAQESLGPIDIFVHCAGARVHRAFLEMSYDEWKTPFNTIVDGAFLNSKHVLPDMIEKQFGRIIFIGGVSGQTGAIHRAGVVSAKSALRGLTKALAREYALDGITVNTVSPGRIDTSRGPWTSQGDEALTKEHYTKTGNDVPVGHMGNISDVADACLFIASDNSGYITGQTLSVNGGIYME